jgi:hypothetical protein
MKIHTKNPPDFLKVLSVKSGVWSYGASPVISVSANYLTFIFIPPKQKDKFGG